MGQTNETDSCCVVANGDVYNTNYIDLKARSHCGDI